MADSPLIDLNRIKGVILDWDGVIAETRLDFGPLRERFFDGRQVPLLEGANTLPEIQRRAFMDALEEEELKGATLAVPVPGVFELVELLKHRGIEWCILSRNSRSSLELAARNIGFPLPPYIFTRESKFIKPDPRAMGQGAWVLNADPKDCLAVGDYLYELLAARRCGMRSVLVQNVGPWSILADGVYSTLQAFIRDFKAGEKLIPWEYHPIVAYRGLPWLEAAWPIRVTVHSLERPQDWQLLLHWAYLGVGSLGPVRDRELEDEEWATSPGLPPDLLRRPLTEVLRAYLSPRYPLVSIHAGPGTTDLRNPDPQAFIESRLS